MEIDLKKVFYILVGIAVMAVVAVAIIAPSVTKIKSGQAPIENINFTQGVTTP